MKDGTRPARYCRLSVPRDDGAESDDDMIPTFIGHCPGSPCAVCGRIDLPGGATAQPDTRPLCGAHFATWERQRAEIETDRAARDRPPVRDIREAMHPASNLGTVRAVATDGDLVPIMAEPDDRLDGTWTTLKIDPATLSPQRIVTVTTPHVATLPDGTRLNLPAGTVLREGVEVPEGGALVLLAATARNR